MLVVSCSSDTQCCDNPTEPVAFFATPKTTIEAGTTITFENTSRDAKSYSWIFNGGDPLNSTEEKPNVTYDAPGTFSVSLTAVNNSGITPLPVPIILP